MCFSTLSGFQCYVRTRHGRATTGINNNNNNDDNNNNNNKNKNTRLTVIFGTRHYAERGGSPLVSFDHVIDPHFVTFFQQFVYDNQQPQP